MARRRAAKDLRIAEVATVDLSVRYLLRRQIEALSVEGWTVEAVCAPGPYVDELRDGGMLIRTVPMRRELGLQADLSSLRALVRLFREREYDVVITHTPKAGLLAPLAARLAGVPVVIHTVHGFLFHDRMSLPRRVVGIGAEIIPARFADYLFFQSREDHDTARRTFLKRRSRLVHVGNGIAMHDFPEVDPDRREAARRCLDVSPEAFVVGTTGRLVWEKGYAELLEVAGRLRRRHPEMVFLAAGPMEPDQNDGLTHADVSAAAARGDVRFLGHCDDMPAFYAALDLFVLPSHREGIPRGLMEASASGLPVVASDIRGCREVVEAGVTGLLFPVRDADELAVRIEQLYADSSGRAAMGRAGRRRILAEFDEDLVMERRLTALRGAVERSRAGTRGRGRSKVAPRL